MPADRGSRGHYFLAVKHNQPTLLEDITAVWDGAPAWDGAPPAPPQAVQIGQHGGRVEQRRLWASDLLVGYSDWPHLAQVCKIERIVRKKNVTGRAVAYAVTSLPPQEADADRLLALWRGHWGIENRVHWVRDALMKTAPKCARAPHRSGCGHQCAATGETKSRPPCAAAPCIHHVASLDRRTTQIGKSRGGRTTKIIAACDENGQVFNILVVPGNDNEGPYTANFTRGIDADHFIGDKAYDSGPLLEEIAQRGTEITVPPRSNRLIQRTYDKERYKTRHLIENAFQKMKRFRGIATRYKKTARMYIALIILILIYLVTKIGKSALRMVDIWRPNMPTAGRELYVPEHLREEYERSLLQRRADFDWFSPPNQSGWKSPYS